MTFRAWSSGIMTDVDVRVCAGFPRPKASSVILSSRFCAASQILKFRTFSLLACLLSRHPIDKIGHEALGAPQQVKTNSRSHTRGNMTG